MIKIIGISLAAIVLLIILIFFLRSAGSDVSVSIDQVALALEVNFDNEPTVKASVIPASAENIYVAGQVNRPERNTDVRVRWIKLPDTVIATEDFDGKRNTVARFDFDNTKPASYFASHIERPGIAWELGEYKAEVFLDSSLATTVFYEVVSDQAAEEENARGLIRQIRFGDALATDSTIETFKTTFSRSTPIIYIQLEPAVGAAGAKVEISVRHISTDTTINTFTATLGNEASLVFDLPLSRYSRFWADRLWPTGSFEVTAKVNGIEVANPSFIIQ